MNATTLKHCKTSCQDRHGLPKTDRCGRRQTGRNFHDVAVARAVWPLALIMRFVCLWNYAFLHLATTLKRYAFRYENVFASGIIPVRGQTSKHRTIVNFFNVAVARATWPKSTFCKFRCFPMLQKVDFCPPRNAGCRGNGFART